jgi:hypothetical protein
VCLESELFDAKLLEELVEHADKITQGEGVVSNYT